MGKLYDLFMVPMEKWDGECWRTMFETLSAICPEADPWDVFAQFMHGVLKS